MDTLADELVPAATAHLPARPEPRRTILCGQSPGGLTTLAAARTPSVRCSPTGPPPGGAPG
ncbi:hypothetical protein ACSCB1_02650 [Streptomyces europaeiscabiei]|uniref:hypothetical protein n=1 Tax=Streptomyces europaeiscabiei TaxID=146819 RepID=UPI000D181906